MMLGKQILKRLVETFGGEDVVAIGITGSYARGTETRYSDVDVCVFGATLVRGNSLEMIDGYLVSATRTTIAVKRADLHEPDSAIWAVPGIRQMQVLHDPAGELAALKAEAEAWRWSYALQTKANDYASGELAGYAEEAHKVMGGMVKRDESTMLYGVYGLVLGLSRMVLVQSGALLETENAYFRRAQESAGLNSPWTKHFRTAAGFDTLPEGAEAARMRSLASLRLYSETARFLHAIIKPEHRDVIERTLTFIEAIKTGERTTSPSEKE